MVINSETGTPEVFSTVVVLNEGAFIKGCTTDTSGHFNIEISATGVYTLESHTLGGHSSIDTINHKSDTNLTLYLSRRLIYDQPCRKLDTNQQYSLDLPNSNREIIEYQRIMSETRIMNLKSSLFNEDSIHVRLWYEPAFEYLGGGMYQISYSSDSINLLLYEYSSNFASLSESHNSQYNDTPIDSLLKFTIDNKAILYPKNDSSLITIATLIKNILDADNYCLTMRGNDRTPALDGVTYHLEIKHGNTYKFITFENPNAIKNKYTQVDLFLELLDVIINELVY